MLIPGEFPRQISAVKNSLGFVFLQPALHSVEYTLHTYQCYHYCTALPCRCEWVSAVFQTEPTARCKEKNIPKIKLFGLPLWVIMDY